MYMVDPIDGHAVQLLDEFDGKKLKSTTKGSEGLIKLASWLRLAHLPEC